MSGMSISGVLRLDLQISTEGPLPRDEAESLQAEILDFFKERKLNVLGDIKYVNVRTSHLEKNYSNLDTSS